MILNPMRHDVVQWLEALRPEERLLVMTAMMLESTQLASTRRGANWAAAIDRLQVELNLSPQCRVAMLVGAGRMADSMRSQDAPHLTLAIEPA
jgi:hypothetical protein